jgi:hypothetical protein
MIVVQAVQALLDKVTTVAKPVLMGLAAEVAALEAWVIML